MNINDILYFDRKNYYYFDLPKGYQITQNKNPIAKDGIINLSNKIINIERIHLEEDAAKSIHKNNKTYLNYNRSGTPLIEIVSKPEISTSKEATEYVQKIKDLVISLDISDGKMEEGSLRVDVNISLRPIGQKELGTKVEIKNLNSISNIEKSIEIEIKKQIQSLLNNEKILNCTKKFDEEKQDTVVMRMKFKSIDYKFFPEPNIPPIYLGKKFINSIKINELPDERKQRYLNLNISKEYVEQLISNIEMSNYFDLIKYKNKDKLSKLFFSEIVSLAKSLNKSIVNLNIKPSQIKLVLKKLEEGLISGRHAKLIIPLLVDSKNDVEKIIKEKGIKLISDKNLIIKMINELIEKNKNFIEKNKERKERINKFILGQLMKESKGQINPKLASKILKKIL
jgi:aspartyl-tRNA(Asn)/glutamyl-tRNA(Gln) amidotransferase subunit B